LDIAFVILIVLNSLLALVFLASGVLKLARPRETLPAFGMQWTADATNSQVRLAGVADTLGGLGLLLPVLTNIAPILTPIAAVSLAALMVGAVVVHVRRKESPAFAGALLALSIVSAVLGFAVVA
jgi:uncharacterized membrane protein YphA (DoxX/SURF4 family)